MNKSAFLLINRPTQIACRRWKYVTNLILTAILSFSKIRNGVLAQKFCVNIFRVRNANKVPADQNTFETQNLDIELYLTCSLYGKVRLGIIINYLD